MHKYTNKKGSQQNEMYERIILFVILVTVLVTVYTLNNYQ